MSATDIDLAAADWLQKKTFWNWTDEDQKSLDAWLDESEAHRVAFWRQSAMWNRTERLAALRPLPQPQRTRAPERKSIWPLLMRSAAVIGSVHHPKLNRQGAGAGGGVSTSSAIEAFE